MTRYNHKNECSECKEGIIEYIFTSDRFECDKCNSIWLYKKEDDSYQKGV